MVELRVKNRKQNFPSTSELSPMHYRIILSLDTGQYTLNKKIPELILITYLYRGADKSLARPISRCIFLWWEYFILF